MFGNRSLWRPGLPTRPGVVWSLAALFALSLSSRAEGTDAADLDVPEAAVVGGKYSQLLREIEVPADEATYGKFFDHGYYCGTQWAGYTDLPAGYWVYVAPHWYIWGSRDRAATHQPAQADPDPAELTFVQLWQDFLVRDLPLLPLADHMAEVAHLTIFAVNENVIHEACCLAATSVS